MIDITSSIRNAGLVGLLALGCRNKDFGFADTNEPDSGYTEDTKNYETNNHLFSLEYALQPITVKEETPDTTYTEDLTVGTTSGGKVFYLERYDISPLASADDMDSKTVAYASLSLTFGQTCQSSWDKHNCDIGLIICAYFFDGKWNESSTYNSLGFDGDKPPYSDNIGCIDVQVPEGEEKTYILDFTAGLQQLVDGPENGGRTNFGIVLTRDLGELAPENYTASKQVDATVAGTSITGYTN